MTNKQKYDLIELCLRNALRYARGEIKYNHDLHLQLQYAYDNVNPMMKSVMKSIFDIVEFDDGQTLK